MCTICECVYGAGGKNAIRHWAQCIYLYWHLHPTNSRKSSSRYAILPHILFIIIIIIIFMKIFSIVFGSIQFGFARPHTMAVGGIRTNMLWCGSSPESHIPILYTILDTCTRQILLNQTNKTYCVAPQILNTFTGTAANHPTNRILYICYVYSAHICTSDIHTVTFENNIKAIACSRSMPCITAENV